MKIKSDFITNSSSSAFVIIGVRLSDNTVDYNEMWKLLDKYDLRYFGEEGVIGKVLSRLDYEDYGPPVFQSLSSLEGAFRVVEDAMRELGISEEVYLIADMFST
jgi:hypothetical protein